MDTKDDEYRISFFKPTTELAKINRNLILLLVTIWAVAIFGFQIALRLLEKPTKEANLLIFESVWDNVQNETATPKEYQQFAQSTLSVLGKIAIKPAHRQVLNNAFSYTVYKLSDSTQKVQISNKVISLEQLKATLTSLNNPEYKTSKTEITNIIAPIIDVEPSSVAGKLLPLEMVSIYLDEFKPEHKTQMQDIMNLYLTHNQSFLTDKQFLGFPFHYFYTAVFLLILFVSLCWIYCKRIDTIHVLLNIDESR